jgi:uncharacterized protein YkwD
VTRLRLVLVSCAATAAFLAGGAGASTGAGQARALASEASLSRAILVEINATRAERGLLPIRASKALAAAAQQHSLSMARAGYFAHESADGTVFWKRVQRFYPSTGFASWRVGENLLWASPNVDPAQIVRAWLDSPMHRKIMLAPDWQEAGMSAVHAAAAYGEYGGREVTIVTADFGARVK